MRVAIGQYHSATDDYLTFARQLGVGGVQFNISGPTQDLPGTDGYWRVENLKRLKQRVYDFGLCLEAIENVPRNFYLEAMLGRPGRDAQIENYQRTVRNMGEAGIPLLGLNWMPGGVWRTPVAQGRGGVTVTAFDREAALAGQLTAGDRTCEYSEALLLDTYLHFMEQVLPVAEAGGVRIALHPDDPPLPSLGQQGRLFYKVENFRKVLDALPSRAHGLDFCIGCFSEMLYVDRNAGEGVLDALRHFGSDGRIFYVHFRDVQGNVPRFQECFPNEGNVDMLAALRTLQEVGFDGFLIDDHVPAMLDDSAWHHRGRAWCTGYLIALVQAVQTFS
ncbi:MAG: mannonate dehydratase [Anaerolineae bacterium]|nr:mannonate dehydratase [Anaerolineae bacterium]